MRLDGFEAFASGNSLVGLAFGEIVGAFF